MISSFRKSSTVAKGQIKKWIQLLIATGLMAIETGTDKNAIDRIKHHRAGAARADNGLVVYKKVGQITQTC